MATQGSASLVQLTLFDGWAELRLNRPEKRNALSPAMVDAVLREIATAEKAGAAVIILSAAGSVFCAGADLSERTDDDGGSPSMRLIGGLLATKAFLIAEVAGPVLGVGVALVACCPVAYCSTDAWFALPEGKLGFFPAPVARYLQGLIPPRLLLDMGLGERRISAEEAAALHLVTQCLPTDELHALAVETAERQASRPDATDGARRFWQQRFG